MNIISLTDAVDSNLLKVGGKAYNLAKLLKAGFPVPPGWIIPTGIFHAQLITWGIHTNTSETEIIAKIHNCELSPDLISDLETLPDVQFAIRSSAVMEDSNSASYSGVFDTVMGVQGITALIEAIRQVWASAFTPEAISYHRQVQKTDSYPSMAVLLMPLVDAIAAGVAFSANPVDGNPFVIMISANYGLGTTVVDGKSPVDRYLLDWDTLTVNERTITCKTIGEFQSVRGGIEKRTIDAAAQEQPVLDDATLAEIGRLVRDTDRLLDARIDLEFAITPQDILLLQARPVLGLTPYFPDDPRLQDTEIFCCHQERMGPLSPYAQSSLYTDTYLTIPSPPWPMEVDKFIIRHGRAFAKYQDDPEVTDCPDVPWEDRSFIKRMLLVNDPDVIFNEWYQYADIIYEQIIPLLRTRSERILRITNYQLHDMSLGDFSMLAHEAIKLDAEANMLYLAISYPTYETLRRIDILIRDCIQLPWLESQQVALTMIQGSPKLTHLRDAEIEEAARTGYIDDVIAHWGYSYLRRDDLLDISTWKSWSEDPEPLHIAISNIRKMQSSLSITERVRCAAEESDIQFIQLIDAIHASVNGGERYAGIFAACVRASRRLFPLKDDRDIVLSHAQSAVRWVICEAAHRFMEAGSIARADDIFLLHPNEIEAGVNGRFTTHQIAALVDQRREEQMRLSRYTIPVAFQENQDNFNYKGDDIFQGEPVSAGIAEGVVRIISTEHPEDIAQLQPGEILWLRGEGKVGWTMYFPIIAGLIYNGNWLCHETNLCRELGIPAVIGIQDMPGIQTGDLIRLNGGTGVVTLIQRYQDRNITE